MCPTHFCSCGQTDRQTERQTDGEMTKPIFAFREYANSPKHGWLWTRNYLIRNYHEVLRKLWLCSFVCDILCALNHKQIILKRRSNALEYMNVILSHINHRYISALLWRSWCRWVQSTITDIMCRTHYNRNCILYSLPWRCPHEWPKHVGGYYVLKLHS